MRARIDETEARRLVLSSANEDYCGLYEIIWEFNSRFPDAPLGEKYAAAECAIRTLHSEGLIELHRMIFTDDYRDHRYERLDPGAVDGTLSNPVSWYPDHAHIRIVFSATQAGERAYYSGRGDAA